MPRAIRRTKKLVLQSLIGLLLALVVVLFAWRIWRLFWY
jgi:hypothetical protein